ncbi:hypothetical protein [Rubritalea sp.]|uniref:hypothetical protein n=1 Tax=Rubritalea sp. TaxID=2109375 RepID=UPI003EF3D376
MKLEGYNWDSKITTRYRILSVMRDERQRYALEKLKIESLDPSNGKVKSYSYLEFFPVKKRKFTKIRGIR